MLNSGAIASPVTSRAWHREVSSSLQDPWRTTDCLCTADITFALILTVLRVGVVELEGQPEPERDVEIVRAVFS